MKKKLIKNLIKYILLNKKLLLYIIYIILLNISKANTIIII